MKNIFRFLMAAVIFFGAVSCAKEDISSSLAGGEVEVTFTANLPELGTRAYGDGLNATLLRYYVYDGANGAELEQLRGTATTTNGTFSFTLPLIKGMTYDFVLWADKNVGSLQNPQGFYAFDGKIATINYNGEANNNDRDAFYGFVDGFDPVRDTPKFFLHRPFAQLNAATSDKALVEKSEVELTTSTITVKAYDKFDITTGDIAADAQLIDVAFTAATMPCNLDPVETLKNGYDYLSMNYLLVPEGGMNVDVAFTFNGTKGIVFEETEYTNVPLKQNYRTNILGQLLTKSTEITVEIEEVFGEPAEDYEVVEVATAADLLGAIANASTDEGKSTEIVLSGNINLNDLFNNIGTLSTRTTPSLPIVIPENKNIVLNLNGCTISTDWVDETKDKHYYAFENNGTLTITGNGTIAARGNHNRGTMIVENGTINAIDGNGGYAVRNYENATFIMNGGKLATTIEDDNLVNNGGYDATTLRVDEGATATINGGVIENICDYTFAIDNSGDVTIKGGTISSVHSTISTEGTMTINGGSFTCNGLEGVTAHALVAWDGSTTTINGGTFDGKDNFNGFNIDACEGAVVTIKGGNFLPVHSGSLYGDGTITVYGGTFFDNAWAEERLAKGYTAVLNSENTYTVEMKNTTPSTEQEFIQAVAEGGIITLQNDITLTQIAVITEGNTVLDGNGHTITSSAQRAINVSGAAEATIKNLNIVAKGERAINIIQNTSKVNIENVTATAANYTVNVAGSSNNTVVAIKESTLNGLCTVNVSGAGAMVALDHCTVNCNDNNTTEGESYSALSLNRDAIGGSIIATNTTVNVPADSDSNKGRNSAANGVVTINGSTDGVAIMVAFVEYEGSDYYYSFTSLQEAINWVDKKGNGNITLDRPIEIVGEVVELDLKGETVTAPYSSAIVAKEGAVVTIKGEGKILSHESFVRAIGGEVIVENGEFTQTGTALDPQATYRYAIDCREGGKITINGGEFKSKNGMINVGSEVIINGGKFENIVEKTMTRHFAYVSAPLTITGGEFYGKANSSAGGCFFCGAAAGGEITITGGKFTSLWTSGSVNRIFEYYYGGKVKEISGGLFNTNGGIANLVVANTDEATKDAYPYMGIAK